MCQRLGELRQAATALAARFDPALVAPGHLAEVLRDAGATEKMMATLASLTAARMATSGPAATAARQAVREVARASRTSLLEASRAVEAGKQLGGQPDIASVALAGELSRQPLAVAVNAGATPACWAWPGPAPCKSWPTSRPGPGRRAKTWRREARPSIWLAALRSYVDASGAWNLHAQGTPEQGAQVMAAVTPFADKARLPDGLSSSN